MGEISKTTIQMGPGKGMDIFVFSATFNGTYSYTIYRVVKKQKDFLGEWNQDSDKKHGFAPFGDTHAYEIYFSWKHAIIPKQPKPEETEVGAEITVLYKHSNFEFVQMKYTRI